MASPRSPDIRVGEDFQERIDKELAKTDVAVVIVTEGIHSSEPALGEIRRLVSMKIPIIPFVKDGVDVPNALIGLWKKVKWSTTDDFDSKLIELELNMWRRLDYIQNTRLEEMKEGNQTSLQRLIPWRLRN